MRAVFICFSLHFLRRFRRLPQRATACHSVPQRWHSERDNYKARQTNEHTYALNDFIMFVLAGTGARIEWEYQLEQSLFGSACSVPSKQHALLESVRRGQAQSQGQRERGGSEERD